ncbi:MAG: response regulator [Gemmataceae bacterium]
MSGSLPDGRLPGVLIVDQDGDVRHMLTRWLRRQGYEVWTAPSADSAVEICRTHPVDLAFIEINLPARDGLQTLADLRLLRPDLVACFMGSHYGPYTKSQLASAGAQGIVHKPFSLFDLSPLLRNLVFAQAQASIH